MEKKKKTQHQYGVSICSYGARFIYGSTTTHDGSATIHHGGATNAHDAPTIRHGAGMIQAGSAKVASRPLTNVHDLVVVMWQFAKFWHQKVSMIRKYNNHLLQTNPRHREEKPQSMYSNYTYVRQ